MESDIFSVSLPALFPPTSYFAHEGEDYPEVQIQEILDQASKINGENQLHLLVLAEKKITELKGNNALNIFSNAFIRSLIHLLKSNANSNESQIADFLLALSPLIHEAVISGKFSSVETRSLLKNLTSVLCERIFDNEMNTNLSIIYSACVCMLQIDHALHETALLKMTNSILTFIDFEIKETSVQHQYICIFIHSLYCLIEENDYIRLLTNGNVHMRILNILQNPLISHRPMLVSECLKILAKICIGQSGTICNLLENTKIISLINAIFQTFIKPMIETWKRSVVTAQKSHPMLNQSLNQNIKSPTVELRHLSNTNKFETAREISTSASTIQCQSFCDNVHLSTQFPLLCRLSIGDSLASLLDMCTTCEASTFCLAEHTDLLKMILNLASFQPHVVKECNCIFLEEYQRDRIEEDIRFLELRFESDNQIENLSHLFEQMHYRCVDLLGSTLVDTVWGSEDCNLCVSVFRCLLQQLTQEREGSDEDLYAVCLNISKFLVIMRRAVTGEDEVDSYSSEFSDDECEYTNDESDDCCYIPCNKYAVWDLARIPDTRADSCGNKKFVRNFQENEWKIFVAALECGEEEGIEDIMVMLVHDRWSMMRRSARELLQLLRCWKSFG